MPGTDEPLKRAGIAADIVASYVEHNSVPPSELPALIRSVHDALLGLLSGASPEPVPDARRPKVPVRKSVSADFIVCLEDGRRFKSLKRHLHAEHGLSPDAYRAKWGLAKDYPMVAPAYADARATLARTIGLGRRASGAPAAGPGRAGHDGSAPVPDAAAAGAPEPGATQAA